MDIIGVTLVYRTRILHSHITVVYYSACLCSRKQPVVSGIDIAPSHQPGHSLVLFLPATTSGSRLWRAATLASPEHLSSEVPLTTPMPVRLDIAATFPIPIKSFLLAQPQPDFATAGGSLQGSSATELHPTKSDYIQMASGRKCVRVAAITRNLTRNRTSSQSQAKLSAVTRCTQCRRLTLVLTAIP